MQTIRLDEVMQRVMEIQPMAENLVSLTICTDGSGYLKQAGVKRVLAHWDSFDEMLPALDRLLDF